MSDELSKKIGDLKINEKAAQTDTKEELNKEKEKSNKEKIEKEELNKESKNFEEEKIEESKQKNEEKVKKEEKKSQSPFLAEVKKEESKKDQKEESKKEEKEDEKNQIFSAESKLYRFMPKVQELKERGIGNLTITLFPDDNLYGIRMIREQIQAFACNHFIEPTAVIQKQEQIKNAFVWTTTTDVCDVVNVCEDDEESIEVDDGQEWKKDAKKSKKQTFIGRFRTEEISNEFYKKFEEARQHNIQILKEKKTKK